MVSACRSALCLAVLSCLCLAAAAANPDLHKIPVSGDSDTGPVTGTYKIEKFAAGTDSYAGKIVAEGTLTVILNGVTSTLPLTWPVDKPAAVTTSRKLLTDRKRSDLECDVLNLVLGPLNLNLLGLEVNLNQVILNITANPVLGLLGSLLCAVAGPTFLGQLSALNAILAILGL